MSSCYSSGLSASGSSRTFLYLSAICWALCCGMPCCWATCTGAVSAMPYAALATNIKFAFVPGWLFNLLTVQFLQISNHFLTVSPCNVLALYCLLDHFVKVLRSIPTKKLNTSNVGNTPYLVHILTYTLNILSNNSISSVPGLGILSEI